MKAIEIINKGSAGYLQMTDREIPVPQKGEVLVKVHAAGINRPDVLPTDRPLCRPERRTGHSGAGNRR